MRLLITLVGVALLFPAAAFADGGAAALIKDCQDEKIDGSYTAAEYRDALSRLPTDVDEYTGCRDTLRSAQLRSAASPGSVPAGGGVPTGSGAPLGAPAAALAASVPPGRAAQATPPAGRPVEPPAGAAPPPAAAPVIPGLPASALPVGGSDPAAAPIVPLSVAAGAGEDVPPTLAVVLVVLAAGLLAAAATLRRKRRA